MFSKTIKNTVIATIMVTIFSGQVNVYGSNGNNDSAEAEGLTKRPKIAIKQTDEHSEEDELLALTMPEPAQPIEEALQPIEKKRKVEAIPQILPVLVPAVSLPQGQDNSPLSIIRQPFRNWLAFSSQDDSVLKVLACCSRQEYHFVQSVLAARKNFGAVAHYFLDNFESLGNPNLPAVRDLKFDRSPLTLGGLYEPLRGRVCLFEKLMQELEKADEPTANALFSGLSPLFLKTDDGLTVSSSAERRRLRIKLAELVKLKGFECWGSVLYYHSTLSKGKRINTRPYVVTVAQVVNEFTSAGFPSWGGNFAGISNRLINLTNRLIYSLVATSYFEEADILEPIKRLLTSYFVIKGNMTQAAEEEPNFHKDWSGFNELFDLFLKSGVVKKVFSNSKMLEELLKDNWALSLNPEFYYLVTEYDIKYLQNRVVYQRLKSITIDSFKKEAEETLKRVLALAQKIGVYRHWYEEVLGELIKVDKSKEMNPRGHYMKRVMSFWEQHSDKIMYMSIGSPRYRLINLDSVPYSLDLFECLVKKDGSSFSLVCKNGFLFNFLEHRIRHSSISEKVLRKFLERIRDEGLLLMFRSVDNQSLSSQTSNPKYLKVLEEFEADESKTTDAYGNTKLHQLCNTPYNSEFIPKLRYYLEKGCDSNARNNDGKLAIDLYRERNMANISPADNSSMARNHFAVVGRLYFAMQGVKAAIAEEIDDEEDMDDGE